VSTPEVVVIPEVVVTPEVVATTEEVVVAEEVCTPEAVAATEEVAPLEVIVVEATVTRTTKVVKGSVFKSLLIAAALIMVVTVGAYLITKRMIKAEESLVKEKQCVKAVKKEIVKVQPPVEVDKD